MKEYLITIQRGISEVNLHVSGIQEATELYHKLLWVVSDVAEVNLIDCETGEVIKSTDW
jgi:hypothetical protein